MTRNDFIDNIQSWTDLIIFCEEEECDVCCNVYSEDARDEIINEDIINIGRDFDDWIDLRNYLDDIPTGYEYYVINDDEEWEAVDDYFVDYKYDVLYWGDCNGVWDEEDYEDDEMDDESDDLEDEEPEEGCSLDELFTSCSGSLQAIKVKAEQENKQEAEKFSQFIW